MGIINHKILKDKVVAVKRLGHRIITNKDCNEMTIFIQSMTKTVLEALKLKIPNEKKESWWSNEEVQEKTKIMRACYEI